MVIICSISFYTELMILQPEDVVCWKYPKMGFIRLMLRRYYGQRLFACTLLPPAITRTMRANTVNIPFTIPAVLSASIFRNSI